MAEPKILGALARPLRSNRAPSTLVKVNMLLAWLLLVIYMFGLPHWSWLFNDYLGYGAKLCTLDAADVDCGNLANDIDNTTYADLARKLNRTRPDGTLWGCSCGEGVFGDWACVLKTEISGPDVYYFSISYFVSVGPGTGALALFAAFPILSIWLYGGSNSALMGPLMNPDLSAEQKDSRLDVVAISQAIFQICFGLFQFASLCVFPNTHMIVVLGFILAEVVHFTAIAYALGCWCSATGCWCTPKARAILIMVYGGLALMVGLCVCSIVADPATNANPLSWFELHAFYLGEALGFGLIAGIPVALVWLFKPEEGEYAAVSAE